MQGGYGRRRALKELGAGLGLLALSPRIRAQGLDGATGAGAQVAGMRGTFARPLPIPPELVGQADERGTLNYALHVAGDGRSELVAGLRTPTWGYSGGVLGPTLRVPRGKPVRIRVTNALSEPTTVHWHGAQVPGRMDGGPHNLIPPGGEWEPTFALNQPAATLWYHPHPDTFTGPQVYAGLAGFLLVDDGSDARLGLPRSYGVDDIPLVIQDRRLGSDGRLLYMNTMHDMMGMKGDRFLVNGVEQPYSEVPADWVRLRLLNGSNARLYNLAFHDDRHFHVVAGDAGLLERPVSANRLLLAPGERAEILVDLRHAEGRRIVLRSNSGEVVPGLYLMPMAADGYDRGYFELLELRVAAPAGLATRLPGELTELPRLNSETYRRDFLLDGMMGGGMMRRMMMGGGPRLRAATGPGGMGMGGGGEDVFAIDGRYMRMSVVDRHVRLGSTEVWRVGNRSTMAHPFHVHGISFFIRARNGAPPPEHERGWKDVVLVRPREVVELAARFDQPADAEHPFMYHCHILEHEDNGMMGQFTVT